MPISYNGITFDEPAEVLGHEKVPVYDAQNNYLWTRIRLTVFGTYNPATCAYNMPNKKPPVHATAPNKPNADAKGVLAPNTEKAVRHQLSQSRGTLSYTIPTGSSEINVLQSPSAGNSVDANNGPTCHVHEVREVWGCKTFYVSATFETCINEASLFVATPSVLLSNVYSMHHSIDQDAFTTRVVRGRATFRTDRLQELNRVPDDFRAYLFLPTPPGFWRVSVDVDAPEDGNELQYTIVDKEMAFLITDKQVSRIEATHTAGIDSAGSEKAVDKVGGSGIGGAIAGAASYIPFGVGDLLSAGIKTMNAGASPVALAREMVPQRSDHVVVRVWGRPGAQRSWLRLMALKVLQARLSFAKAFIGATNFQITEDVMGRFVELRCSTRFGPFASTANLIAVAGQGGAVNPFNFPDSEDIAGVFQGVPYGGGGLSRNIALNPNGRGDYIGRCAVAAILGQNSVPVAASDPGQSVVTTPP